MFIKNLLIGSKQLPRSKLQYTSMTASRCSHVHKQTAAEHVLSQWLIKSLPHPVLLTTTLLVLAAATLAATAAHLQIKNEQLSGIVRKVQGESEYVLKQAAASVEKQERLAAQLAKLSKSLEQTEERIRRSLMEGKVGCSLTGCDDSMRRQWL